MSKIYKLGDLAEIGRGSSPRPITDQRYFINGDIPWIKIADATSTGKYIYETREHVNEYGASFSRKLKPNTLIIAASGTLGFPKFLGCEGCIHDGWMYFSDIKADLIEPNYLYYSLITLRNYYNNLSYGAAIQNINTPIVKKTKIELPTLDEQEKVADILSTYDNLIENNNRRIALLEKAAQELYKEWFVRFRFPGYESAEFENGIPKGWGIKKIGEIARVKSGYAFKSDWWTDEGISVIKIKDIQNNTIDFTDLSRVSEENSLNAKQFFVTAGDLLIAMTGATIGKLAIVPHSSEKLVVNQRVGKFFCGKQPILNIGFLYFTLQQTWVQELIAMIAGSNAAQPNISPFDIEKIKVLYNEKIVENFNNVVSKYIEQILLLIKKNQNLIKQRDLLLPRLMSGKLEV